jgi:uncharacterized Zn ribbon protein
MGSRTSMTDNVSGNHTYTFNAANQLTAMDGNAYNYDANGNTLAGGGRVLLFSFPSRFGRGS